MSRGGIAVVRLRGATVVAVILTLALSACARADPTRPRSTQAGAGYRTVVSDRFSGPTGPLSTAPTGQRWRWIHDVWWVGTTHRASAHRHARSVYGYAVLNTKVSNRYTVQADVTLSPTPLRAAPGLVANFVDRKNYLFAKVEVTAAHPHSFLALGDQRRGVVHSTLCRRSHLGMVNGGTYRLSLKRAGSVVTAAVRTTGGVSLGSCSITLSTAQRNAFGRGTRFGMRVKIVRDEDDGRSRWDNFMVRTHP
jgi:hypothetical protein